MNHDNYSDNYIRSILNTVKTIAMVGISPRRTGQAILPSNICSIAAIASSRLIPGRPQNRSSSKRSTHTVQHSEPVDMVDIFRSSEHVLSIVEESLRLTPRPQVIWMQLTVRDGEAASLAEKVGLKVVMNRCPKIEYGRLSSEISWIGVNSRTLSSKRAQNLGTGLQRISLGKSDKKDAR